MKPGSDLVVLEFDSLGSAYEAVQDFPGEVLELIPGAKVTTVLVALPAGSQAVTWPKAQSLRHIKNLREDVITAWLGLENPPLGEALFVVESASVGDLFEAAQRLSLKETRPFDLRILRGTDPKGYVLATGAAGGADGWMDLTGTVLTKIENPSAALKSFFEIAPQKL